MPQNQTNTKLKGNSKQQSLNNISHKAHKAKKQLQTVKPSKPNGNSKWKSLNDISPYPIA